MHKPQARNNEVCSPLERGKHLVLGYTQYEEEGGGSAARIGARDKEDAKTQPQPMTCTHLCDCEALSVALTDADWLGEAVVA
jgi:hypothetical protein